MKNAVVGWVVLVAAGSSSTALAQAHCNDGVPMVNTVMNEALGADVLQKWEDWYNATNAYRLEGGITGTSTAPSSTLNKHILATILTHYGVKGAEPVPEYILGAWTFSAPPNRMIAHRSIDEYGPLTYGIGAWAWDEINSDGNLGHGAWMHGGHRIRMVPGKVPWASNGWDFTFDGRPERRIDYSCEAFSKPVGELLGMDCVGLAGTLVHEALHSTGAGHQAAPLGDCRDTSSPEVCDYYVPNSRPSPKGGIVGHVFLPGGGPTRVRTPISVGANQGGAEFFCDFAASPEDWVPVMASLVAQGLYHVEANVSRWINVPSLPFTCGPADGLLRQAGYGVCEPSIAANPLVCRTELGDADCLDGQSCEMPDGVCSNDPTVKCAADGECQNSLSDMEATCVPDLPTCSHGICTDGVCSDPAGSCVGEGECCAVVK